MFEITETNEIIDDKHIYNYALYEPNTDLILYTKYSNNIIPTHIMNKYINSRMNNYNNNFDIDCYFYKYINNIDLTNTDDILKHIINTGFEEGFIYHPKQIKNLFPSIKILNNNGNILIEFENKIEDIRSFVNRELYQQNFNWYLQNFIESHESNIHDDELLLIVFIGDINIGNTLINNIIKYKRIQPNFALSVCFRNKQIYDTLKNKILNNFNNYILYTTTEFGSDIIPSLLVYNNINKIINFDSILKLQTKTDLKWFNELTNYLLSKNINELKNNINLKKCNCLGNPNKYYSINSKNEISMNSKLNIKYKHLTNKLFFVAGTIFYCKKNVFDKILDFISKNNYRAFFTNNLYDNNMINITNSLIHYLERLFGIITT